MNSLGLSASITLALFLPSLSSAQQGPSPNHGTPTPAVMPLDGSWVILDEFMNEGDFFSGSWSWTSSAPVRLTVTDLFVVTDQFEIYDNGVLVQRTPFGGDWDDLGVPDPFTAPPYETDPDLALTSGFFSNGSVLFGPGTHLITIRDIHFPPQADGTLFADGTVAFKAEVALGHAFALETWPGDGLIRFDPSGPAGFVEVNGSTGSGANLLAMDYDPTASVLYCIDWLANTVGTIDPATGVWTETAALHPAPAGFITGLSVDPTDGTVYICAVGSFGSYLYTLDVVTGALGLIGNTLNDPNRIDIAINGQGEMYGHCTTTDSIYLIDKSTGQSTLVGPTNYDCEAFQGLDFDESTGTLYATLLFADASSSFASIDVTTGSATLIPGLPPYQYALAFAEPSVALEEPGTPYCFGDPGVGTPCPCSNDNDGSVVGAGCDNGIFSTGARLMASGTASVSDDSLVLTTYGLEPNNFGLYFQADNRVAGGDGTPFGDGLRCAGGDLQRLQVRPASALGSSSTTTAIAAKAGNVDPGDVKRYQCWYRTQATPACGLGVNEFNLSNGYEILWLP